MVAGSNVGRGVLPSQPGAKRQHATSAACACLNKRLTLRSTANCPFPCPGPFPPPPLKSKSNLQDYRDPLAWCFNRVHDKLPMAHFAMPLRFYFPGSGFLQVRNAITECDMIAVYHRLQACHVQACCAHDELPMAYRLDDAAALLSPRNMHFCTNTG